MSSVLGSRNASPERFWTVSMAALIDRSGEGRADSGSVFSSQQKARLGGRTVDLRLDRLEELFRIGALEIWLGEEVGTKDRDVVDGVKAVLCTL